MPVIEIYRYQLNLEGENKFSPYEWGIRPAEKGVTLNGFRVNQKFYACPDHWYTRRGCISQVGSLVEHLNAGRLQFEDLPQELLN